MTAAKQLNNPPKTEKKHKGNPNLKPGPGRPKGSQNKLTKTVKQAVLVAREDPKTFAQLLAKCIPAEVTGKDGAALIPEGQPPVLVVPAQLAPEEWSRQVSGLDKK